MSNAKETNSADKILETKEHWSCRQINYHWMSLEILWMAVDDPNQKGVTWN